MRSSPTIPPLFSRIWPQRAKALFPSADETSVALLSISAGNELDELVSGFDRDPSGSRALSIAKSISIPKGFTPTRLRSSKQGRIPGHELSDRFDAKRKPKRPRQASLRRAVSTSYYALFHLLICEATATGSGLINARPWADSSSMARYIARPTSNEQPVVES